MQHLEQIHGELGSLKIHYHAALRVSHGAKTHDRLRCKQADQAAATHLQASPKERAENLMIVDLLRNDLSRIAELGSVKVPSLFDVQALPTVWQMTSTVTARSRPNLKLSEAFAAWLPPFGVPLSYAVAIGYVVVDTIDKGLKAYSNAGTELEGGAVARPDVDVKKLQLLLSLERATDTIVWQLLASVFVPGFTIHTVVQAAVTCFKYV